MHRIEVQSQNGMANIQALVGMYTRASLVTNRGISYIVCTDILQSYCRRILHDGPLGALFLFNGRRLDTLVT